MTSLLNTLRIELWPLDKLIPYARNARTHSDTQVAQIAASIKEFGFVNPILVGTDCVIIVGHGRLLAARKLGMMEVPVIVLEGLTENQRRALVLADNKLAINAGWDEEALRLEIEALRDADYDLNIIGFEDDELARLLESQDANGGLTDEDAGRIPQIAHSRRPQEVEIVPPPMEMARCLNYVEARPVNSGAFEGAVMGKTNIIKLHNLFKRVRLVPAPGDRQPDRFLVSSRSREHVRVNFVPGIASGEGARDERRLAPATSSLPYRE